MTKKRKKTIKKEIEKEFNKRFVEFCGRKVYIRLDTGEEYQALLERNAVRVKEFIFNVLYQTLQRFIEELFPPKIRKPTNCCRICVEEERKKLKEKAKQWLKENL